MSYTPLNLNCISSFVTNTGLSINSTTRGFTGSVDNNGSFTPGTLLNGTFLQKTVDIFRLAFDIRFPVVAVGDLVIGRKYYIRTIGTMGMDFTLVGAPANQVGIIFTATSTGSTLNNLGADCNDVNGDVQTGMTLQQYTNLMTMGNAVPLMTNIPPPNYQMNYYSTDCKFGFLGELAVQARSEFNINNGSYADFFNVFTTILGFKDHSNTVINSLASASTHLDGTYSNMNDLMTGDIAGVSLSTFFWGQDLVNSGRAIDLTKIDTFGNPDNLLRTLYHNKAITKSLSIALNSTGITVTEITDIINGRLATPSEQKLLYAAFMIVMNQDLQEILVPLNCQTKGLTTLADLLNPKMLFPNSYSTLTFPQYNTTQQTTNSKTYYFIYSGTSVNKIPSLNYGIRLQNIMPSDIAYACDTFSFSMQQIKNIKNIDIEKFSQVVMNLENVNDLAVNGTNVPTNIDAANSALNQIAYGSGTNGTYKTGDFFASIVDGYYPLNDIQNSISTLSNLPGITTLDGYLNDIYTLLNVSGFTTSDFPDVQSKIDSVNNFINNILVTYSDIVEPINALYNTMGTYLYDEKNARKLALPNGTGGVKGSTSDIYNFINSLQIYASETQLHETATVLESISDTSTLGGQSLIGSMREIRNSQRMGLMGGQLNNIVQPPQVDMPVPNGTSSTLNTTSGAVNVTVVNGAPIKGSLGGSPHTTLIPDNLNVLNMATGPSVLVPTAAINHVTTCNCDCWELLQ